MPRFYPALALLGLLPSGTAVAQVASFSDSLRTTSALLRNPATVAAADSGATRFLLPFVSLPEQLRQVAGVQATPYSGAPGTSAVLWLRGAASLGTHAQPLYVVDGVPMLQHMFRETSRTPGYQPAEPSIISNNPLLALPATDIATVEVLKDAWETAQYGSMGQNGVIRITTRQAAQGQPLRVNYSGYGGVQQARYRYDLLSAREYAELYNEARTNSGSSPWYSPAELAALGNGTDWQQELLRTAAVQEHQVGMSGSAGSGTRYYAGLNYLNQQGVVLNSRLKRYHIRANVDQQLGRRLHLSARLGISQTDHRQPDWGATRGALLQAPTMSVDDPNLNRQSLVGNPVIQARQWYTELREQRLLSQLTLQYTLLPGLVAEVRGALEQDHANSEYYYGPLSSRNFPGGRGASFTGRYRQLALLPSLRYEHTWADRHRFRTTLSGAIFKHQLSEEGRFEESLGGGYTFSSRTYALNYLHLTAGYTYADRYELQASLRSDGSTALPAEQKWQWLKAAKATWHADREAFLQDQSLISQLEVWTSWGQTANIGNFFGGHLQGILVPFPGGIGMDYTFALEKTTRADAGATISLWQDRFSLTAAAYQNRTQGSTVQGTDFGQIRNRGIEVTAASRWRLGPVQGLSSLAGSINDNRYHGELYMRGYYQQLINDQPLSTFYGYRYEGLTASGAPRFQDVNRNGLIDPEDQQPLGSGLPKQLLNLTQQLAWRRFDLQLQADGMFGYMVNNTALIYLDAPAGSTNASDRVRSRGQGTGVTAVPRARTPLNLPDVSTYTLQAGDHMRLSTARVSYEAWKKDARSASVWIGGQNLLVISRYRGFDPNVSSSGADATQAGIDANTYPTARTWLLGVTATL